MSPEGSRFPIPPVPHSLGHPLISEGAYDDEQLEFLKAMEAYKRIRQRPFPTCCEVLAVLKSLGYRKVAQSTDLPKYEADTPSKRKFTE